MSIRLEQRHELYLERTARDLARKLNRKVTTSEVAQLLIELAILDEERYDPDSGAVLSTERRTAVQPERDSSRAGEPAGRFAPQLLLRYLRGVDR